MKSGPLPLIERIHPAPDAESALLRWKDLDYCLFLDSALKRPRLGRYSFLVADPFAKLVVPADGSDALQQLQRRFDEFSKTSSRVSSLPPFQGGAAGLFAYDLNRSLERIPRTRYDEFNAPALAIGFYDVVLAIDHEMDEAWLISQGWPEKDEPARRRRAAERLDQFLRLLEQPIREKASPESSVFLPTDELAPQFQVNGMTRLTSNFSSSAYRTAVARTVEYIAAGDAFQVNLSQRLLHPVVDNSLSLYLRLRRRNPATFAAYFDLGEFQIVSASPERFLRVEERHVEARPIKGTRQRLPHAEASLFAGDELRQSEKDRAENVMIVDLLRNDLSRVCHPQSVRVTELCHLETYEYVQHLVSAVCGYLREDQSPIDLLRASFPGGSITGAPKVRAMEIIAELEPTARGPYCGCLGYIGFDGSLDLSILIRTITAGRGWWQMQVGGGITAQSDPQKELEETWHKATGMLKAIPK